MIAFFVAIALATPPSELAGTWAPPCFRTVIGTGSCQRLEVKVYASHIAVYEIVDDRARHRVVDGRHVFRETTTRTGPLPARIDGDSLTWESDDGATQTRTVTTVEGTTTLVGPDRTWSRQP
ncbi:MAG: hypothetical protein KC912_18100 [Proteobacteria bacterium]|nr:hypothetical protein [Pseudomonadota bacterium]